MTASDLDRLRIRLAYHRLFNMSKLSMERHLTQMSCDFVDKLKAKGRKLFLVRYRTQTSTTHPLQPTCNTVRVQSLHNDTEPTTPVTKKLQAQATLNFIDAAFFVKNVTVHHWIQVNKKTLILFQIKHLQN